MTYAELLPIYQQATGLPGQDDAFNSWVQNLINTSGSQTGLDGIPPGYVTAPGQTPGPGNAGAGISNIPGAGGAGAGGNPAAGGGMDLGGLVAGNAGTATAGTLPPLNTLGGNYATNQVGGQTGGYSSLGGSNSTQSGSQTQNTAGTQTGAQMNTGTQTNTGTSNNTGTSTSTTGVNAPFDVGSLVNSQLGTAGAADASRTGFLTDVMNTGGQQFGSQVDQAVRNSLSGPQMTGAGDSARARAAGYAGAQVGRNNLDQRLGAAGQLGNANANVNSTIGATSPLYGSTTSGSNTNSGATTNLMNTANQALSNNATTGSSNTMDLQHLVANEGQAGTASGSSVQQAGGLVPQGQPVKTGGCVVCTAYVARGEMKPGAIRRAVKWKQANWLRYRTSLTGYLLYGPFIARAVLSSDAFARTFRPLARAVLYHEVHLSAPTRVRRKWSAYILHGAFDFLSYPVGLFALACGREGVCDQKVLTLLRKQNLEFPI